MSINELKETFTGERDFTEILKKIGGTAVNVGTDMVIGALLAAGLCPKKGIKRMLGCAGIFVLSMKIGDMAEDYFCELVDDIREALGGKKENEEENKEETVNEE